MCFSWKSESEEKPFKLKKQQKFVLLSRQTNVVLSCRSQSRKSSWQAPPPSRTISFFPRSAAVSGWRLSWKPEDGLGASAPSGGEPTYLWGCRIMLVMEGGQSCAIITLVDLGLWFCWFWSSILLRTGCSQILQMNWSESVGLWAASPSQTPPSPRLFRAELLTFGGNVSVILKSLMEPTNTWSP